jgi:hypothetical protein
MQKFLYVIMFPFMLAWRAVTVTVRWCIDFDANYVNVDYVNPDGDMTTTEKVLSLTGMVRGA